MKKDKILHLRTTKDVYEKIKHFAELENRNVSNFINHIIAQHFKKEIEKEEKNEN